jgi:ribosomal protein L12E/L44/L45/RPP1/RPP2
VLINLNEAEVKFVIHAVQESAAKILAKLEAKPVTTATPAAVRLTKAGRPAKKPGRKPKPALKTVQPVEQAA